MLRKLCFLFFCISETRRFDRNEGNITNQRYHCLNRTTTIRIRYSTFQAKRGFHGPTNRTDERHKVADLLDLFSWCHQFVESAD